MAANTEKTMSPDINKNCQQCFIKILLYIDIEDRIKLREVCKEWRDAVDASWEQVRHVKIIDVISENFEYEAGGVYEEDSDDYEETVSGTHGNVLIQTSWENKLIEEVLKRCGKHITTLVEDRLEGNPLNKNNPVLPLAMSYCSNIEKLDTNLITNKDDKNMSQLLSKMDKLKSLTLRIHFQNAKQCFRKIPDNLEKFTCLVGKDIKPLDGILIGLKKVIDKCSVLKELSINYFDDNLLKLIGQKMKLETLKLGFIHSDGITQNGFHHIWNLKNLRALAFTTGLHSKGRKDKAVEQFIPPVTDGFLKTMVKKLPMLEVLEIEAAKKVTDEGFKSLEALKKLKKLRITDCKSFIGGVELIPFSGLEELDLTRCEIIDDEAVIGLLEKAEAMRVLNLDYTWISDETLEAAVKATEKRTNGINLTLSIHGTDTTPDHFCGTSSLLTMIYDDVDDMFMFPNEFEALDDSDDYSDDSPSDD